MEALRQQRLEALYSDTWTKRLKAFVSRRYNNFGDWEGWFEEAHQNLALKINGMPLDQDINDALIFAIFKNELITVKRNRLGYPRPRAWLREFSELGQELFEWMCLQRLTRSEILERAFNRSRKQHRGLLASQSGKKGKKAAKSGATEPGSDAALDSSTESTFNTDSHGDSTTDTAADSAQLAAHKDLLIELTDTMIEKKECDGVRPTTMDIDDESVGQLSSEQPGTDDTAEHAQLELMLSMILGADNVTQDIRQQAAQRLAPITASLKDEPLLDDMDILILRCYYFQGMSQNDIAKLVKLPLQKVVRQREAAIKRIRSLMEDHGLNKESFNL